MATQDDVRRLSLELPGTSEDPLGFRFFVDETAKQGLLSLDPDVFFTEPHYDGFPAVPVRLTGIDPALLQEVIHDAWRSRQGRRG